MNILKFHTSKEYQTALKDAFEYGNINLFQNYLHQLVFTQNSYIIPLNTLIEHIENIQEYISSFSDIKLQQTSIKILLYSILDFIYTDHSLQISIKQHEILLYLEKLKLFCQISTSQQLSFHEVLELIYNNPRDIQKKITIEKYMHVLDNWNHSK